METLIVIGGDDDSRGCGYHGLGPTAPASVAQPSKDRKITAQSMGPNVFLF